MKNVLIDMSVEERFGLIKNLLYMIITFEFSFIFIYQLFLVWQDNVFYLVNESGFIQVLLK